MAIEILIELVGALFNSPFLFVIIAVVIFNMLKRKVVQSQQQPSRSQQEAQQRNEPTQHQPSRVEEVLEEIEDVLEDLNPFGENKSTTEEAELSRAYTERVESRENAYKPLTSVLGDNTSMSGRGQITMNSRIQKPAVQRNENTLSPAEGLKWKEIYGPPLAKRRWQERR